DDQRLFADRQRDLRQRFAADRSLARTRARARLATVRARPSPRDRADRAAETQQAQHDDQQGIVVLRLFRFAFHADISRLRRLSARVLATFQITHAVPPATRPIVTTLATPRRPS